MILILMQLVRQWHFEKHRLVLSPSSSCLLLLILYFLHFPLLHTILQGLCQGEAQVTPNFLKVHPTCQWHLSTCPTNLFHHLVSVSNPIYSRVASKARQGRKEIGNICALGNLLIDVNHLFSPLVHQLQNKIAG